MLSNNIPGILINALVYDDSVILHDLMLGVVKENKEDQLENQILFSNLVSKINYNENNSEIEFHNGLVQLLEASINSEVKTLKEIAPYIKKLKKEKSLYYLYVSPINKKKYKLELLKRGEQKETIFIGYNFNKKNSNKIYKLLKG